MLTFFELLKKWIGLLDLEKALWLIWILAFGAFAKGRGWLKDAQTRESTIQWIRSRPVKQWYQSTLRAALEWCKRVIDPQLFGIPSLLLTMGLSGITALTFLLIGWVFGTRGILLGVELLPVIESLWVRTFAFLCLLLLVAITFWLSRRFFILNGLAIFAVFSLLLYYNFQNGPLFGFGYVICLSILAASISGVLVFQYRRDEMQSRFNRFKWRSAPFFFAFTMAFGGAFMARNNSKDLEVGRGPYFWFAMLFYIVIPACNGFWSWISFGFSRFLGERILKNFKLRFVFLHLTIDLLVAVAIFLVSVFTSILILVMSAYDVDTVHFYVEAVLSEPWGEGLWASLTMLVSLVPSLLHFAIIVVSGLIFSWTSGLGKIVAQRLEKKGTTEITREIASAYIVFPLAIGFSLTIILAWDVPRLLSLLFPSLADLVDSIAHWALDTGAVIAPHLTMFNQIVLFVLFMLALMASAFLSKYISRRRQDI